MQQHLTINIFSFGCGVSSSAFNCLWISCLDYQAVRSTIPVNVLLHDHEVADLYVEDKVERLAAYNHNAAIISMLERVVGPDVVERSVCHQLWRSP